MSPTQVESVCNQIRTYFPRCTWSNAEFDALGLKIERLELTPEQSEAVVSQLRTETRFDNPDMTKIIDRMRNADAQAKAPKASSGPRRNLLVDRYRRDMGKYGIDTSKMSDVDVAVFHATKNKNGWTREQRATHLVHEILSEFVSEWRDRYEILKSAFPDLVDEAEGYRDYHEKAAEKSKERRMEW